jgi:uncharacterized membrane protein YjgN (DUF898 family)
MAGISCNKCGFSMAGASDGQNQLCPRCGGWMEGSRTDATALQYPEPAVPADMPPSSPEGTEPLLSEQKSFRFHGTAREYFRIWIVNVFLTVVTLGVYAAWAKVRTRRYFYANTTLAEQSFDYLANPKAILKGNLIIGAGLLIYFLTRAFSPAATGIIILAFYLTLPFLIYKSLRFKARNSAFRNIRFRFLGTLGQSYKTYLLYPILIPVTLGLIVPYWAYRRKEYLFANLSFGNTPASFNGASRPFYRAYALAGLAVAGIFIAAAIVASLFPFYAWKGGPRAREFRLFVIVTSIAMGFCMVVIVPVVKQYLEARLANYCWGCTSVGAVRFSSTLKARRLALIYITNIIASIFSLGLLIPWAKVRRTRYVLESLTITTRGGLDNFTASIDQDVNSLGDTATDFFDLEIGL